FRVKIEEWLKLSPAVEEGSHRIVQKGDEKIRVVPSSYLLGADETCDDILVVNGDLACGKDSTLRREFWSRGNAQMEGGSSLQAGATEGSLNLGPSCRVARWIDASGEVSIGRECQIGSRVTSRTRVRLGLNCEVASPSAPEVVTEEWNGELS